MVASSVPLLRPLFSAAKSTATSHYGSNTAYELDSRQKDSQAFVSSSKTPKSTGMESSSEENILPIQEAPQSMKGRDSHFEPDVEQGVIKKEVRYQIKYETDTGSAGSAPQISQWNVQSQVAAH
jgi:hypothetical protein